MAFCRDTPPSTIASLHDKRILEEYCMNIQKITTRYVIGFLLVGLLGFVPRITVNGYLLGVFKTDAFHILIYVSTGLLGFWAMTSFLRARLFLRLCGLFYVGIAIAGFVNGGVVGPMVVNVADNIAHLICGSFALYVGFARRPE